MQIRDVHGGVCNALWGLVGKPEEGDECSDGGKEEGRHENAGSDAENKRAIPGCYRSRTQVLTPFLLNDNHFIVGNWRLLNVAFGIGYNKSVHVVNPVLSSRPVRAGR